MVGPRKRTPGATGSIHGLFSRFGTSKRKKLHQISEKTESANNEDALSRQQPKSEGSCEMLCVLSSPTGAPSVDVPTGSPTFQRNSVASSWDGDPLAPGGTEPSESGAPRHAQRASATVHGDAEGPEPSACCSGRETRTLSGGAAAHAEDTLGHLSAVPERGERPVRIWLRLWTPCFPAYPDGSARVALQYAVESPPDAATRAEARRWAAHHAAFVNDVDALMAATAGWGADDWERWDCCGNTVGHVATMRTSRDCLLLVIDSMVAAGASLGAPNSAGWTMLEESIDRGQLSIARALFDATEAQGAVAPRTDSRRGRQGGAGLGGPAPLKAQILSALAGMPDFSLRLKWKLGSPLLGLILRKALPSDTYHIWKCGDRLRIDGTLVGLDMESHSLIPKWKSGHFSILLAPPLGTSLAAGKPEPRLVLVNRAKGSYMFIGRILKKSSNGDRPAQISAEQPSCRLRLFVHSDGRISASAAGASRASTSRVCAGCGGAAADCALGRAGNVYVGCTLSVVAPVPSRANSSARFEHLVLEGVRQVRTTARPESSTTRAVTDWKGQLKVERVSGVPTTVHEASMKLRIATVTKRNLSGAHGYALAGSFEGYVAARGRDFSDLVEGELLQVPVSYGDLMKSVGWRDRGDASQEGSLLKARVWLARGLPLTVEHMQMLLNLIGLTNRTAANMAEALGQWDERDAFVMRLHVPLFLSLYGRISVEAFQADGGAAVPPSHYNVPADFKESDVDTALQKLLGI